MEAVLRLPFAHYLSSHAPHPLPKAQVAVHLHHLDQLRLEDPSRPGPYAPWVCRSQYREQGRRSVLLIDRGLVGEGELLALKKGPMPFVAWGQNHKNSGYSAWNTHCNKFDRSTPL